MCVYARAHMKIYPYTVVVRVFEFVKKEKREAKTGRNSVPCGGGRFAPVVSFFCMETSRVFWMRLVPTDRVTCSKGRRIERRSAGACKRTKRE